MMEPRSGRRGPVTSTDCWARQNLLSHRWAGDDAGGVALASSGHLGARTSVCTVTTSS